MRVSRISNVAVSWRSNRCLLALLCFVGAAVPARAQTATYHLHNEASTSIFANRQMRTDPPAPTTVIIQSADLKNATGTPTVNAFDTLSNVPSASGTIPAFTTVSATVWMKKTASYGVFKPYFSLYLNSTFGSFVAGCAGPDVIDQTLQSYLVSCQTQWDVLVSPTDRYLLLAGVSVETSTNHSVKVELDIEGTTDSFLVAPLPPATTPVITSLSPTSGPANWTVTIGGTDFGGSQGSSTVKFNQTIATPTDWATDGTAITVPVPASASLGSNTVVVTVGGIDNTCPNSNCTFNVIGPPSLTSLSISTGHISDPVTISGNNFMTAGTVTFSGTLAAPSSWNNTSITVPVPSGATSGNVVVTVSGQASNALPFTVIPPPTVTSAYPGSGQVGTSVTVWGSNFGATQGTSTLTFHGTTATVSTWTDTRIDASVPAGATTGDVVVVVANQTSNGVSFNVLTAGTMSGTITRATGGSALSGASVQAVLTGIVKGSATTAANGTYSITSLDPGTYDVRVNATGFSTELRQGIVITASGTTTVDAAMYAPGSVAGRVTQSDGITPIVGAAVAVFSGPTQKGAVNTNGTGDYTVAGLHPGTLTVQAANVGYRTSEQAATVSENTTTTKNFSLDAAATGPVLYAYDELGRLVQVTDPNGDSAIYRYDRVGNITAIERPGGATVAISGFTPISGLVGATVTIYGAGFSATPAQNTMTFMGVDEAHRVPASVTTATPTQLVVTVPPGAMTGSIAVTTPTGSATSSTAFTVLSTSGAPTITGFTPGTIASGTALTVNGTNFETLAANNNLRVNISPVQVSSATATALQTTLPASATTGRVSVATPNGTAVSSNYLWVAPWPFLVTDLDSTATLPFATGTLVSVPTANKVALRVFDGTEGHRASINVTGLTANATVYVFDPFGKLLASPLLSVSGFVDTVDLRSTATYSVVFDPSTTNATTGTLTLYDVPADVSGTIVPTLAGTSAPVAIGTPGQNGSLTFAGTAGQRISIKGTTTGLTGQLGCDVNVSILKPDGSALGAATCMEGSGFMDIATLPAAGTYRIFVDPVGAATGTLTLTVYDVPSDFNATSAPGGTPVTVEITTPGQNGAVTFAGTALQRISLEGAAGGTIGGQFIGCDVNVSILNPDNSVLAAATCMEGGGFIDVTTLPTTGTYTIVVDPVSWGTGNLTLTLYNVPADVTGSVTVNGTALPVSITPGQNANVTFVGTHNQKVRGTATTPGSGTCATLKILRQNNSTVVATYSACGATITMPQTTLPVNETYHFVLDPTGAAGGSFTVRVVSP
jgi:YD repeat-containing protein